MKKSGVLLATLLCSLTACNTFPCLKNPPKDSAAKSEALIRWEKMWEKREKKERKEKKKLEELQKSKVNELANIIKSQKPMKGVEYKTLTRKFEDYEYTEFSARFYFNKKFFKVLLELASEKYKDDKTDKRPLLYISKSIRKGYTLPKEKIWISFHDYKLDGIWDWAQWYTYEFKGIPYFYLTAPNKKLQKEVQKEGSNLVDKLIGFLNK